MALGSGPGGYNHLGLLKPSAARPWGYWWLYLPALVEEPFLWGEDS